MSTADTLEETRENETFARVVSKNGDVVVSVARDMNDLMRVFAIRSMVYMGEQVCPYEEEFDGNDLCATHLIASINGEPVGTLRIRWFANFAKYERAAVRSESRGGGEPLRVCRRLHSLRGWSHEQAEDPAEVFAGGA